MKNLILIAFVILTSVCFGQTEMKIYKKNGQVESVPITQIDSVKYSTSSPTMMNVHKNNNPAILSISINDIDSVKYLTNGISVGNISGLNCANATNNGTLTTNTVASGVNSVISYTGGNGGTYTSQTISSTGALGLTASLVEGTFANGNGTLTFTITGKPTTSGTASFEITVGGKTCVFTRSVELPVGTISALDCANAINTGVLTANTVVSGVNSVISYTGGNGGTYTSQTISSTGVLGLTASLAAGTFANGNGTLTYTITGKPTTSGTASFEITIGGKTCVFTRSVELPIGTISALDYANATNNGTLTANTVASGVNSVISYTGGNGGTYTSQTISSTGVLGLTASLVAGTFANGNGTLTYTITGKPTTSGTASFEIMIGGKTCVFTRSVELPVGTISALDCANATNNGLITYEAAFEIETPSNLKGFYNFGFGDSTLSNGWGNGVLVNKSIRGELKLVNSKDSLAGTDLSEDYTGKIALIYSGTYGYAIKALNAQKAGASAVIIMNHGIQTDGSVNDTLVSNMTGILTGETKTTATGLQVKIPIILISKQDRDKILSEIKKGTIIKANVGAKIVKDINSVLSYTGGNGGSYEGQTISSTGVSGLTATLAPGIITEGNGTLMYAISGVPNSSGDAVFSINFNGTTCVLARTVIKPGFVSSLDCQNLQLRNTLTSLGNISFTINKLVENNVVVNIPYTYGNGGVYDGQVLKSSGVEGITLTLEAGKFLPIDSYFLTYAIKGTPNSSGSAFFNIRIGGQSCILKLKVDTFGIPGPIITDIDGNNYKTVIIGTQTWMAENLKVSTFNNGEPIRGNCYPYNGDVTNRQKYGNLYTWELLDSPWKVCPVGWHIPSDAEWTVLTDYLSGGSEGGKMKEVGTTSWNSPNTDATNISLFTGLPAGSYDYNSKKFDGLGNWGAWWSSTVSNDNYLKTNAFYRSLSSSLGNCQRGFIDKRRALSVRCIKD